MNATSHEPFSPRKHIVCSALVALFTVVVWLYPSPADSRMHNSSERVSLGVSTDVDMINGSVGLTVEPDPSLAASQESVPHESLMDSTPETLELSILLQEGDTLSKLFERLRFDQKTLYEILSADEPFLALETLQTGEKLYFRYKPNSRSLMEMELFKRPGHKVIYRRVAQDEFAYETVVDPGKWRSERITGVIENSFYLSAKKAGLSKSDVATITQIFGEQLSFSREIQKGDRFQVVRSVHFVADEPSGLTRIESVRLKRRAKAHTAFLFEDGRYYDERGRGLKRAFTRTPLAKAYRISSSFNPKRLHPLTRRVRPHNGTDFATPTGTKVLTTGDGIVARVGNHPFAGRYVEIQHGSQYKTRYLHLHRVLVRKGEKVKRGQSIALSGNTGRSTGPHLHFELHVNGKPVDPMSAKIPISRSISKKQKIAFAKRVKSQVRLLDGTKITTTLALDDAKKRY